MVNPSRHIHVASELLAVRCQVLRTLIPTVTSNVRLKKGDSAYTFFDFNLVLTVILPISQLEYAFGCGLNWGS